MQVLKIREVMQKVKLGRSSIYRGIGEETFPKSIPLTDKSVGWLESEIDEWIAKQVNSRNDSVENTEAKKG